MDIVDTRADVAGVGLVLEDLEELGVALAVLDGEDVSIEGGNGVEEVLELGVAEVRVDLGGVLDTGNRELEGVDSPGEVLLALSAGAEGKTLAQSRLIDLDDVDTSGLKIDHLVAQGKSKLLSLDGLVNVITRERPPQAGDGARKHTLHGLAGDRDGVLGLLDGHGGGAGDVTDNDRGADAAGSVRLDPAVGGEDIAVEPLAEVLNHVVALRLTVDKDIEVKLLLDLDDVLDLLLDELFVLLSSDVTLGELVTLDTDVLGLGERADGGRREEGKAEVSLLLGITLREGRLALVIGSGDLGLAVLDGLVVGALRRSTSLNGLGIGLKSIADGSRALSDGLGDDDDLGSLLDGEGEPVLDLLGQLLLAVQRVRGVEQRAGGGNNDTVLSELLDGRLNGLNGTLEVGFPDVASIDNTGREDLAGAELLSNSVELLGIPHEVNVDAIKALEGGEDIEVVDDITEVGCEQELGQAGSGKLLICRLESTLDLLLQVEDEDGLVNLNSLGTRLLELLEQLDVDGDELVEEGDGVDGLAAVGLAKGEERDGADEHGAGGDASLLGLEELGDGLGVVGELEGLAVLEGRLHVVVVGVEPLDHFLQRVRSVSFRAGGEWVSLPS